MRDDTTTALYQPTEQVLSILDHSAHTGIWQVADARSLPYWEQSAPVRHLLHWWMRDRGLQQVHAACIGTPAGADLVVGPGGSGKSTTALAAVRAGLRYVGDDYVLVRPAPPITAYSMYNSAKLRPEQVQRHPGLIDASVRYSEAREEKVLAYMHEHHHEQVVAELPLRAILVPKVQGPGPTRVENMSRADALGALAPSSLIQLPGSGREDLAAMGALVRGLACRRILLGPDLHDVTAAVSAVLEEHAG